jgi:tRNA threonylcarbamoyladenosine biosynthesis protein TsaE
VNGDVAMTMHYRSHSPLDTERLGEQLGRLLHEGSIVCLYGDLGSGKTVFTKGLARGLGVPREAVVRSPSFILMQRYPGRLPLYHADLYRLESAQDVDDIGLREVLGGHGVAVIEWADKLEAALPMERLDVTLHHLDDDQRLITLEAAGARYRHLLARWPRRPSDSPAADASEIACP